MDKYVYLGSQIMDARLPKQVKANIAMKRNRLIKFDSFLKKNREVPFSVKKLVFSSVLSSAFLYGCDL